MTKQQVSGSMVNSMEELKQLGRDMEKIREQQEDDKRERDPKQYDDEQ